MLRNGDDDTSSWLYRLAYLIQHDLVGIYVLEHVEGSDDVELGVKGDPAGIELEQFGVRDAGTGMAQAPCVKVRTDQTEVGKLLPKALEYEAGSAANLE